MSDLRSDPDRNLQQQINELRADLEETGTQVAEAKEIARRLERDTNLFMDDFYGFIWKYMSGVNFDDAKLQRYLPIRLYLSEDVFVESPDPSVWRSSMASDLLRRSLFEILDLADFYNLYQFYPVSGSYIQKLAAKARQFLTRKEVNDRLQLAEAALTDALLTTYRDKPAAEVAEIQARAAQRMMAAIEHVGHASIQCGPLMILKTTAADGRSVVVIRMRGHAS